MAVALRVKHKIYPGFSLLGTKKSLALSGLDEVNIGV